MFPALGLHRFLLVSFCSLALPAALIGQLNAKTDGAFTSLQVEADSRFGHDNPRQLTFVWYPELSPETTYRLDAECSHRNRLGGPPETALRVAFKGSMVPLSTGNSSYKLKRKRAKLLEDGSRNRRIQWQDPVFADLANQGLGDGVLVEMELVLKGDLSFGDIVTCEVGMSEASSRPIL